MAPYSGVVDNEERLRTAFEAALAVGRTFWKALADDDAAALVPILTANALNYVSQAGIDKAPSTLREHLGISRQDCSRLGWHSKFSILDGHDLRVTYTTTDSPREIAPEFLLGWRIEFVLSEGAWLVDPVRPHGPAVGTIEFR